jgi:hypothetical protein
VKSRRVILAFAFCLLLFAIVISFARRSAIAQPRHTLSKVQAAGAAPTLKTRAVVLIVLDGLRWQEVFDGPEHDLMNATIGGVQDADQLRKDFWRDTAEEGRRVLMPFLWNVVAQQGQIYGNQHKGSVAQVTNGFKFSQPRIQRDEHRLS